MEHVVDPDVCTLFLIRHGTTTMNVENRYRGRRDVPLDAQGWADAVKAARALSSIGLSAVYAGPLGRTIDTAQVVADECRIHEVRILDGLVNVDYGKWEGMTAEEASRSDPHAYALYAEHPEEAICPNGERLTDAQARMFAALELIGNRHRGERVAAVTHAVTIRLVVAKLLGITGKRWRVPIGRGSVTRLELRNGAMTLPAIPIGSQIH
jgi:broad specificity phosphatase PhoE